MPRSRVESLQEVSVTSDGKVMSAVALSGTMWLSRRRFLLSACCARLSDCFEPSPVLFFEVGAYLSRVSIRLKALVPFLWFEVLAARSGLASSILDMLWTAVISRRCCDSNIETYAGDAGPLESSPGFRKVQTASALRHLLQGS